MNLIPKPKSINMSKDFTLLKPDTRILLDSSCTFKDMNTAFILKDNIKKHLRFELPVSRVNNSDVKNAIMLKNNTQGAESYSLSISKEEVVIDADGEAGLFYGCQTLCQLLRQYKRSLPLLYIQDKPAFKNRGFYHDITRGKVPTLDTLKELAYRASFYKLNQLQLYIEHTFAFENITELWPDSDPLTAEEIMILDEYCKNRHIELVPSLATFGHLYHLLVSKSYSHLCELEDWQEEGFKWLDRMKHHTLDPSNPESIKLIEAMLDEFIPIFTSNTINICADETFDLGMGKNKEQVERAGKGRVYVDFLNKIIAHVKKYDRKVMFWGDIVLKYPKHLKEIPQDVICLNWDYASSPNENNIKKIADAGITQYLCPGVSGWNRFTNDMDEAFANIFNMANYGNKYNAQGILNTDWGDFGHVNLFGNSIPGMVYGASLSWNPVEEDTLKTDENISRMEYGDSSGKIAGLLRVLARQERITWGDIITWKETSDGNRYFNRVREKIIKCKGVDLKHSYQNSLDIGSRIVDLMPHVYSMRSLDMKEFYISSRGIALTQSLALAIKKYSFKQTGIDLVHSCSELAVLFEKWFRDYSRLWRERNRESELFRIKDTIIYLCSWLREQEQ